MYTLVIQDYHEYVGLKDLVNFASASGMERLTSLQPKFSSPQFCVIRYIENSQIRILTAIKNNKGDAIKDIRINSQYHNYNIFG